MNVTEDVLFVGRGSSAVAYYRCMLPAMGLGCDWVGAVNEPPDLYWRTGIAAKGAGASDSSMPPFEEYKVVVLQQPHAPGWFGEIDRLKKAGVTLLYECDDYLHGIPKVQSHGFRKSFDKAMLKRVETMMRMCDGLIVSTEFLAKRYRKFNPNVFVCENAIDMARYDLTRPKRDTVNIGWAGATGHKEALMPWLAQVGAVMEMKPDTTFVSIGQPWATALQALGISEDRTLAVPFSSVEQYPAAMAMIDIALAPAGKGSFFRGKSDLRWLEAGALGIPIIADPMVYSNIEDGKTGFLVADPMEMAVRLNHLIIDPEFATRVGENAREYVRANRSFPAAADQWLRVFEAVVD